MRCAACTLAGSLLALLASIGGSRAEDLGGYVIHRFDTQLTVERNATLAVEERIEVEFSEPRHGIYRTIPVRYTDPRGYAYSLDVDRVSVTDETGQGYGTRVSDEGRYKKIRIGDADRTVEGRKVYVIRYHVRDALGQFPEHDELYWNATGNEWNTTIGAATALVRLPDPIATDSLEAAGYSGPFGSRSREVAITSPGPGLVRFESNRSFGALEGMTVAVGWPHGHVRFPSEWDRAGRALVDNWIVLLPFAWFGFLWRRYRRFGRDPEPNLSTMVQYEPPAGLSPGAVGTLIDERADLADITATVVHLAIRRHLTIRQEERSQLFGLAQRTETVFKREPPPEGDALAPHEAQVLNGLFSTGDEVDAKSLANHFYVYIPGIQTALYEQLVEKKCFDRSPEKVRSDYVGWGFGAGIATGGVAALWLLYRGVGQPVLPIYPVVIGVLVWAVFGGFAAAMPRRTSVGVRARNWAIGFQEYARRVESDRLARSASDPRATFETLLPYAMALGVASAWARRYEGIYENDPPRWYVGQNAGRRFSTSSFEQSLSSSMSRAGQSMVASPRSSSGSGGGGSSGGGGGGGGGGSW